MYINIKKRIKNSAFIVNISATDELFH